MRNIYFVGLVLFEGGQAEAKAMNNNNETKLQIRRVDADYRMTMCSVRTEADLSVTPETAQESEGQSSSFTLHLQNLCVVLNHTSWRSPACEYTEKTGTVV